MTINYKKILFIIVLTFFPCVCFNADYAQKSGGDAENVKAATQVFYKKYLPLFGYPSASELQKLRPFLRGSLYSSIKYERERMKIWTAKNPGEKPPVAEDLFICNHDEPPTRFRMGKVTVTSQAASVIVYFDYTENNKIYTTCQTQSSFTRVGEKWLLDNIIFEEGADLRTLLSRKDYATLPE